LAQEEKRKKEKVKKTILKKKIFKRKRERISKTQERGGAQRHRTEDPL